MLNKSGVTSRLLMLYVVFIPQLFIEYCFYYNVELFIKEINRVEAYTSAITMWIMINLLFVMPLIVVALCIKSLICKKQATKD